MRPLVLVLATVLTLGASAAAPQQDFFLEGNRLYRENDFHGALEAWLRIEEAGFESGPLFYNVGNAYFKLGQLGPAILYYERGRRLMPGDDDLEANLALARSLTVDDVAPLPEFLPIRALRWWVYLLPTSALAAIVAAAYVAAMAGLIVLVLRPGRRSGRWGGRIAVAAGAVTLLLGINLAAQELGLGDPRRAVVMVDAADVQSAPAEDPSLQVFVVHEGTIVRIDRRSDAWLEVVLEDGQVGWLRADAVEEI